jgi:hypothetical protein
MSEKSTAAPTHANTPQQRSAQATKRKRHHPTTRNRLSFSRAFQILALSEAILPLVARVASCNYGIIVRQNLGWVWKQRHNEVAGGDM